MALRKNLSAGLLNSLWVGIIGLIVIPFYLRYLGIESYGLIGFFVTMQALMQLLDMGLGPTINREVARCSVAGKMDEARNLLHTLAVLYWVAAGIIAISIAMLAPFIAENWLSSKNLGQKEITHAVLLMGLVVACRWPIGLYQGALIGAQKLTITSGINILMVTLGAFGAVVILAFISPTIEAFFIWQACIGFLHAVIIRTAAWRVIGYLKDTVFNWNELKRIWRFSIGISGIALTGIVFIQLDKVILSKILGLAEFGQYMLATVVVSVIYFIVTPLFNIIYPKFSELVEVGDIDKLVEIYRVGTRLLTSAIFPLAMFLIFFSQELVEVWTGDAQVAENVAPIISLLAIGTVLHGVMYFPYALQLAYGVTWIPLTTNLILIVVFIPLTITLSILYGALGGAVAWTIIEMLYFILGTWFTYHFLIQKIGYQWVFEDVAAPFLVASVTMLIGRTLVQTWNVTVHQNLIFGVSITILTTLLALSTSSQIRKKSLSYLKTEKLKVIG